VLLSPVFLRGRCESGEVEGTTEIGDLMSEDRVQRKENGRRIVNGGWRRTARDRRSDVGSLWTEVRRQIKDSGKRNTEKHDDGQKF
jgi:hypothetical protein